MVKHGKPRMERRKIPPCRAYTTGNAGGNRHGSERSYRSRGGEVVWLRNAIGSTKIGKDAAAT